MPRYAFYILLACALGGCDGSEDTEPRCICKPTMKIEWEPSNHHICNNATFDWLLGTVLGQVSKQSDSLQAQDKELQELRDQLQASLQKEDELTQLLQDRDDLVQRLKDQDALMDKLKRQEDIIQHLNEEKQKLIAGKQQLQNELDQVNINEAKVNIRPKDCADVQNYGYHYSGIYSVYPGRDSAGVEVFCDLNSEGGGWLVFQRRQDGTQDFARGWADYRQGFGVLAKEFWLGNEALHQLTQQRMYELRIDITDFDGRQYYAQYSSFGVDSEGDLYRLHLGAYSGDAGNALGHHDNHPFSTYDKDNDKSRSGNCAELYGGGGWWWVRCYDSNLNGVYSNKHAYETIVWYHLRNNHEPLRHVEMKMRPIGFGKQ